MRQRGIILHLVQESVRGASATLDDAPSRHAVENALAGLPDAQPGLSGIEQRNVHMFVLESFFDPLSLGPEWVPEDPFPPEFRDLWKAAGQSVVLSPVFGGYTANAEFEALCGFPVVDDQVFFEGGLRQEAPCLPGLLADAGYRSVASHPNIPGFWNRTVAYRLAGFEDFRSRTSFDLTDSVDEFLLDHAFYDQVFERLGPLDAAQPTFNYMLTYYGHLPFPANDTYPERLQTPGDNGNLQLYVNQLWYKSRDLVARVERLRADDPEALIVIFGDHLPFLDFGYGVYDEVLGLPQGVQKQREAFTAAQLEFLVTTLLIVIDGQRGPIDVGKLPLYRLPALVLELLGVHDTGTFAWTENPPGRLYRPLYGMHFETSQTPGTHNYTGVTAALARAGQTGGIVCRPDAPQTGCAEGMAWLARTRTLTEDIFSGHRFSLEERLPGTFTPQEGDYRPQERGLRPGP
jgi:hypothetical protein